MRTRSQSRITAILIALVAAMGCLILLQGTTHADKSSIGIESKVAAGYQGMYELGQWYPVRISLTNRSDRHLQGELVFSTYSTEYGASDYVVETELPMESEVEVVIGVPGMNLDKENNTIRFFEHSYKEGKSIPINGDTYATGRSVTGNYVIGVVSRDPDTFNFMPALNQRGYSIAVIPMQTEELPDEATMLAMFDTIVLNDVATGNWDSSHVAAVKEWVAMGGTLVLSGGSGYAKTAEAFQEMAPVTGSGTIVIENPSAIAAAGGTETKLSAPITVSVGEQKSGSVKLTEGGIPIAVHHQYGFGSVIYAAFDASLEPMASWPGSAMLWAKLLQGSSSVLQLNVSTKSGDNMLYSMNQWIDTFPTIKPPSFSLLLLLFCIYILIAAPLLYVLLSRLDRREWAWWIIPSLAVVMGAAVLYVGAGDKRVPSAHSIEVIRLSNDGHAVSYGGAGVFSPTGGTVTMQFADERMLRLYGNDNSFGGGLSGSGNHQVLQGSHAVSARWHNVPYWSTRKVWMELKLMSPEQSGSLQAEFAPGSGGLKLKVTNRTIDDLHDVALLMNGSVLPIGSLLRGESGEVTLSGTAASAGNYQYFQYGDTMFPYPNGAQVDENYRQRDMINYLMNDYSGGLMPNEPTIVAISEVEASPFTMNGKAVKSDNLRLWLYELDEMETSASGLNPEETLEPVIVSSSLESMEQMRKGALIVGKGELIMEYLVPDDTADLEAVHIKYPTTLKQPGVQFTIWHEAGAEWVELQEGELPEPRQYIIEGHTIRVKLESTVHQETTLPQIAIKGAMGNE
ncbi:hypothetical protein M6D81_00640 [Paenibacillus sp. J5C_2022]|uniref:DUF7408 domain-containing protein n=1 Tax=Paenibacillus sp. J5C2022 TaxID=2977129 RepID=UPI0021CE898A|nr:hypothetical protein [Paenibacillus sp. J5C2022]MCU6707199.1 hypothetical protein [Paenibacillus sp. J5C2022]